MKNALQEIEQMINQATDLAKRNRVLTGKPLEITGKVAEFYAAKYLNIQLAPAR